MNHEAAVEVADENSDEVVDETTDDDERAADEESTDEDEDTEQVQRLQIRGRSGEGLRGSAAEGQYVAVMSYIWPRLRWKPGWRKPHGFTGFDEHDDLPLAELRHSAKIDPPFRGPFPIVNCSLNLGGSADLGSRFLHPAIISLETLDPDLLKCVVDDNAASDKGEDDVRPLAQLRVCGFSSRSSS